MPCSLCASIEHPPALVHDHPHAWDKFFRIRRKFCAQFFRRNKSHVLYLSRFRNDQLIAVWCGIDAHRERSAHNRGIEDESEDLAQLRLSLADSQLLLELA